ncbi:MAG TPA: hypothetical protein VLA77_04935 [Candidatus Saccharimonadales bacterium]|nr:hypothetical protein [Candidatus Saccharimonadales bacterium]
MKTLVLYRPNSEHATAVESFLRDFKSQTGHDLPILDVDSREGADLCRLYEIMEYPAIIVMDDQGRLQNSWRGGHFPLISELSYYVTDERQLYGAEPNKQL